MFFLFFFKKTCFFSPGVSFTRSESLSGLFVGKVFLVENFNNFFEFQTFFSKVAQKSSFFVKSQKGKALSSRPPFGGPKIPYILGAREKFLTFCAQRGESAEKHKKTCFFVFF